MKQALLLAWLALGLSVNAQTNLDAIAIKDVFSQFREQSHSITNSTNGLVILDRLSSVVAKIDTSRCPVDFQLAWFDMSHGIERYDALAHRKPTPIADLYEYVNGLFSHSARLVERSLLGPETPDLDELIYKVRRSAISHGVPFHE